MKKVHYILIIILVLHALFVILSMNQPFHGDEVSYAEGAKQVLISGRPIISYGTDHPNFQPLWHIPLYIYVMSGFVFLFGYNIYSVRMVAAVFNFLTIILVYFITKEILKNNKHKEKWALLAAFIYALNPLVIQNSILVEIEGGLLNFSMYLFLYLFIKNKKFYYLIPALVFVFLSKEVGPPLLFLSLLVYLVVTLKFKKIPKLILLFILSGGIAIGLWKLFSYWLNLDFFMPLGHNFGANKFSLLHYLISIWEFKNFVYFAIPFLILLFIMLTVVFYAKIIKNWRNLKREDVGQILLFNVLAILVILLYLYYGGSSWGFPKYQVIAMPAISIFLACILAKSNIMARFKEKFSKNKTMFILLFIVLLFYFLIFIRDPLMPEFDMTATNIDMSLALKLALQTFALYLIIPFIIVLLFFYLMKIRAKIYLILIVLTLFLYFYINILHASVDYSTYNKYGDTGIPELLVYLEENNISANSISTHIHLGSYLGMDKYHEITFVYNEPEEFRKAVVENEKIQYIIIWERDIGRIGENMDFFELENQIGTYYIFKKIS